MFNSELVSIVLPTRNRADFLGRCINAILAQSYSNWELIIVDGASTDDTPSVAQGYCEREPRIRYQRSFPRQGLPRDRNIGVSLAKGDLIYFVEDDVIMEPGCLQTLVEAFSELRAAGMMVAAVAPRTITELKTGRLMFFERHMGDQRRKNMNVPSLIDKWTGLTYPNWAMDCSQIVETVHIPPWSLFSRNALQDVGGFEEKAYNWCNYSTEEYNLYTRLRKRGYKLFFQSKALTHHLHAPSGGTRVSPLKYYYFFLIGHSISLIRNYGWKALYMIPFTLLFLSYGVTKGSIAWLRGAE